MSDLTSRYEAREVENKWYEYWTKNGFFQSEPDQREPYSIVIPPPNVTGILHMGHMLNNTVQDMLARKARQEGKNVSWVPGTDHASIATEAKVVNMLREKGIKKSDLSREEFLKYAWEWTDKYGGIILSQLKKLGCSCDWDRTAFTMDEVRSDSVIQAFCDLYTKGKLYRDYRMVNWDVEAQTVLSNEEVIYSENTGNLFYLKYHFVNDPELYISIATARPETIMGDVAIAVNPNDERHKEFIGQSVKVPLIGREIPIIADDYVDQEFGTGALKVTPAHDVNDYEIGKRHKLKVIDVLNPDGTLSKDAQIYIGVERFKARKLIVNELEEKDFLIKKEEYTTNIGRSERTNCIVEPRLSLQWYVNMKSLAEPALAAVESDEVNFFPKNQKNLYRHWMTNIRDWCISRQLWWGHRIPAYYFNDEVYVAKTKEEALIQARKNHPDLSIDQLKQDEDVLDTWFSSWLWPISCFRGFQSQEEVDYYYPTSVLVTGWDIIFLWVARMIMAGYEWKNQRPFKHVYFTGMVRDKQRRKMSKSLGNSPDALKLIEEFGADGVRFGIMSSSPAGGDLLFDEKLCEQGRNFCNKLWNATKLIKGWNISDIDQPVENRLAVDWINELYNHTVETNEALYGEYKLSEVSMNLYNFIWSNFCSWFLEMIKPAFGQPIDRITFEASIEIFEKIVVLLHPLMPFITEEIYHILKSRDSLDACIVANFTVQNKSDNSIGAIVEPIKSIVSKLRETRTSKNLGLKDKLNLEIESSNKSLALANYSGGLELLKKMAHLSQIQVTDKLSEEGLSFLASDMQFFIPIKLEIDIDQEIEKIQNDIEYQKGFLIGVDKKLSNANFVNNAPKQVVDRERKKKADGEERIRMLTESLKKLIQKNGLE